MLENRRARNYPPVMVIFWSRVRADTGESEDRGYSGRRLNDPSTVPTNVIQPLFHSPICALLDNHHIWRFVGWRAGPFGHNGR